MKLDIRLLNYFLAVASEGSFTRGAARLNMAQPPLSKRIQELEAALGAPVFLRNSRPLVLTPAGQLLFDQATQLVNRMAQLEATMQRFVASKRPRFVLGVVPSTLYTRLAEMIRALRDVLPDHDVTLAELDTPEQLTALREGRINIGFDRIRIDDPDLQHQTLHEERLIAALPCNHPLIARGQTVALDELVTMPLILYPRAPRPSYADLVLSAFARHGATPRKIEEVQEMQTALVMVAAGSGACILPESVKAMARPDIGFAAIQEVETVPLLARYRKQDQSPALKAMLDVIAALSADRDWHPSPRALAAQTPRD